MMGTLELNSLSAGYRRGHDVLEGLDLELTPGRIALLGPNGAGKTTLFRVVSGQLKASGGAVTLPGHGQPCSPGQLRREVGLMSQDIAAVPGLTVVEQVSYAGWLRGLSRAEASRRAPQVLARVGLQEKASSRASRLSGGQLRRVGLAQTLVTEATVMCLDEPTAGLDPGQRLNFADILRHIDTSRAVLLVSTHLVDDIGDLYDQVVVIDEGQVCFQGTPEGFLDLAPPGDNRGERAYMSVTSTAKDH